MLSNEKWFGAGVSAFYDETIDQSLRFNDGDSPYLTRTPSSTSNRRTFTISFWFKLADLSAISYFYSIGTSSTNYFHSRIQSNQLNFNSQVSGTIFLFTSNRKFRDTTNWYHIVFSLDSTQATESDRVKIYVNGEQETSFSTETYPSQDTDFLVNSTSPIYFGRRGYSASDYFDGYLAEFNFIDGQALDPTSFGESKNGVWIPKSVSGLTYGTNGYRLTFADSSNLGDDTSGNGNDFTSSGLASTDVVPDSPTNNFCTLNPVIATGQKASATYSEGNLKYTSTDAYDTAIGTIGVSSGKWYYETRLDSAGSQFVGLRASPHEQNSSFLGETTANSGIGYYRVNGNIYNESSGQDTGFDAGSSGDIIQVAFDADNGYVWFGVNNTFYGTVDTATNRFTLASWSSGQFLFPAQGYRDSRTVNFGQDGSFAGALTGGDIGTATDDNGIGAFKYTPPSGYLALCSSNLPDTTLSPNQTENASDYFSTKLYTGNATDDHAITGVGFQPDWVWLKARSFASGHALFDSTRGALQYLASETTSAESTLSGSLKSFDSDGFTLGTNNGVNRSATTFTSWNWRANAGTTSSNTDGSITSTVQASTDAGFSIVTYTGDGNTSGTIGHGLSSAPEVIILFGRTVSNTNVMGATSQGWTKYSAFGNVNGYFVPDSAIWNDTAPTSTVFSVGSTANVNDAYNYVAYCFHSVEGYSAIGKTYTGNSSQDGTYIHLGFRPAWILIKRANGVGSYCIFDNKINPDNAVNLMLLADSSGDEDTGGTGENLDFLSNGFKLRDTSSARNTSGNTYIYMAFAEVPFKFSNAR